MKQPEKGQEIRHSTADILAAISHDIRTPMNGVLGMAELLLAAADLSDQHRRRAQIIKRSGGALLSMLELLFDVAKFEIGGHELKNAPVDLGALIRNALDEWQNKAPETPRIDLTIDPNEHCQILGDASLARKLFSYLFESLVRFFPKGRISLTVTFELVDGNVRTDLRAVPACFEDRDVENLLLLLNDDIAPKSGGIGEASLNLMMCRQIAKMMGGDIYAHRSEEHNVIVSFDILGATDLAADPAKQTLEEAAFEAQSGKRSETQGVGLDVLVVEDNPEMAMLIDEMLKEAGHRVFIAPDGASIMGVLDAHSVDIILMDGHMPDISGLEATKCIRALPDKRSLIPIIALTGNAMDGDRKRYLSAGMDDYIAKPVDYEMLVETIERSYRIGKHTASPNPCDARS